jgi:hypothetical protein
MAVPLYSTSLIQVQGLVGTESISVPAGQVIVVRDIDVYATGVISAPFTYVFAHGSNGQAFFYYQWQPAVQAWEGWRGRQVFEPGTTFDVESFNGPVDVSVSGYVLSSP